jgi:drug/metabolite transporter (DMT)-like permease
VIASPSSNWTKIILVAIFTVGLVTVILVPFLTDISRAHGTWKDMIDKDKVPTGMDGPTGVRGIARATMALGVLAVIGFALAYILVERPFHDNATIAGNIVIALTTTLAAITAFYFGSKQASDARSDLIQATKTEPSAPEDSTATV